MNFFIDSRDQIADQLEAAARIIGFYGITAEALIAPHPGHPGAILITGTDTITVSPLGAIILANNPGPGRGEYELPYGWDTDPDALWAQLRLAVTALAQYLVTTGRAVWGTDPGATISDWARQPIRREGWTGHPGLSKDEASAVLEAASRAVRTAGPLDPMWVGEGS